VEYCSDTDSAEVPRPDFSLSGGLQRLDNGKEHKEKNAIEKGKWHAYPWSKWTNLSALKGVAY
jgi:hypothetical protein